jgi:hypothetical protein
MKTKLLTLGATAALLVAGFAPIAGGGTPAFAANGGCPSTNSANGAEHANSHSAHGKDKQADNECLPDD